MSTTITGYTLVGIMADWNEFFETKEVAGCKHVADETSLKICPNCGKPTRIEKSVPIDGFNEKSEYNPDMDAYRGLKLVKMPKSNECYLGIILLCVYGDSGGVSGSDTLSVGEAVHLVADAIQDSPFLRQIKLYNIVDVC